MSLNYRRSGVTYQITMYDSTNSTWMDFISVRHNGTTKYMQIDTNLSHSNASHMRVRHNGTTYAVLTTETSLNPLFSFGYNNEGQLGLNDKGIDRSSPTIVGTSSNWQTLEAGFNQSTALRTDGTLWCWGNNSGGQAGQGFSAGDISSPVQVGSDTDWSKISGRIYSNYAIRSNGTLWTWGLNYFGSLGLGTPDQFTSRSSPTQIGALTTWTEISSGEYFGAAIKTDGTLWIWGYNDKGQLGQGNNISRSSPVQVGSLTNWYKISCGRYHVLALKTDGTIWTWGYNLYGQLGDGTIIAKSSPVQIGSLTTWSKISAGWNHSTAIKTDGTFWAWGTNGEYQLCQGNNTFRSSPVQVGSDTDWLLIGSGRIQTSAIKTDGTLWTCGFNNHGNLGLGDTTIRSYLTQVGSETYWNNVATGYQHTLAI